MHHTIALRRDGQNGIDVTRGYSSHAVLKIGINAPVRVETGNTAPRHSVDRTEVTADEYLAVRLHRHGKDVPAIEGDSRHSVLEGAVETAVGIEPGDLVADHSIHSVEESKNERLSIGLQGKRSWEANASGAINDRDTLKTDVGTPVAVHARDPKTVRPVERNQTRGYEHLAVRLQGNVVSRQAAQKISVSTAIRVEPREVRASYSIDRIERAREQHSAVRLQRDMVNEALRDLVKKWVNRDDSVQAILKTRVQAAIRVEPGDAAAGRPVNGGELAGDENPAVGLQCTRVNFTIRAIHSGHKAVIQTAVYVQSGDIASYGVGPNGQIELSPDDLLAVGLHRD